MRSQVVPAPVRPLLMVLLLLAVVAVGTASVGAPASAALESGAPESAPTSARAAVTAGPTGLAGTALAVAAPTARHPFSDPLWLPLREPARISCARSNCTSGTYHG